MNNTSFVPSASSTAQLASFLSTLQLPAPDGNNPDTLLTLESPWPGAAAWVNFGAGAPVGPNSGALSLTAGGSILLTSNAAVLARNGGNPFVVSGTLAQAAAADSAGVAELQADQSSAAHFLPIPAGNVAPFVAPLVTVTGGAVTTGATRQIFPATNAGGHPFFAAFDVGFSPEVIGRGGMLRQAANIGYAWAQSGYMRTDLPTTPGQGCGLVFVNSADAAMPLNCILIGYRDGTAGAGSLMHGIGEDAACSGVGPYTLEYALGPNNSGVPIFGASAAAPSMLLSAGAPPPSLLVQRGTASCPAAGALFPGANWPANT